MESSSTVLPFDIHNQSLVKNVRPKGWTNPTPSKPYNLVVIGAGTAGLVSAAGAAGLGAKVALVEKHLLGGDCLNYGCVPSKGMIRASRVIFELSNPEEYGAHIQGSVDIDFGQAMERMRKLRAEISENDSVERFSKLGVDVFLGQGKFLAKDALEVDGKRLEFSRAIIATGARAAIPPIPGLQETGFLTNETVFSLTEKPKHLLVIGAGPIGCELSQAFRRFGSEVSMITRGPRFLPREDPDAAQILQKQFKGEGINLLLGAKLIRAETRSNGKALIFDRGNGEEEIKGDEILVAVGRAPNVEHLGLEKAGVVFNKYGVTVNDRLQTSNPRVFAAGDICSKFKFTHAADAMARIALQNALFFGRKKASVLTIPWCTYTDPEIAHVGMYEAQAKEKGLNIGTLTVDLREMDRAILDGERAGFARVHYRKGSGRILGATLVAQHAGEMIGEMCLAVTYGCKLSQIAQVIHPYPTQSEIWKRVGDHYMRTKLTPTIKKIFEKFLRWRR